MSLHGDILVCFFRGVGPPSARCPCDARWAVTAVLSRRRSDLRLAIWRLVRGVVEGVLKTLARACTGSFPLGPRGTSSYIDFDITPTPGVCRRSSAERSLSARCAFGDARSVHVDRGFVWNDVDFLLFDVTTEEIRWLQSGVVVPLPPPPRGGAGTFVSGRDANVVRETVISTLQLSCLRALRPVDFCGLPPSLGSCVRRVRGVPCRPRRHPCCPRSIRRGRVPARTGLRRFFFIENRAEVHVACGS